MIALHDIGSIDDDLTVWCAGFQCGGVDFDGHLIDGPADTSRAMGGRTIHGHGRRGFGEAVAVVDWYPQVKEKITDFDIHGGAAGNGAGQAAAKALADLAENEPVGQAHLQFRQPVRLPPAGQLPAFACALHAHDEQLFGQAAGRIDSGLQAGVDFVEDPGYGNQEGGADRGHVFGQGGHIANEADGAAELNEIVQFGSLAEGVGPGQDAQAAAVRPQFGKAGPAGLDIGREVAVRQKYSFGTSSRAGGVDQDGDVMGAGAGGRHRMRPTGLFQRRHGVLPLPFDLDHRLQPRHVAP